MCYFGTNSRLLIYALCVILPTGQWGPPHYSQTGHWGMVAFDSKMGHVEHIKHCKPCLGALMCHFGTNNRLLIYALCVILPTGQWGTPHYSQSATEERQLYGVLGHIKHRNQCLGALMCHFGTNNPFLIHASCGILPIGQWGTPHYSQPATEEWMHLTALWGMWNTSNIENHLRGPRCVIFDHIIQSRCLSCWGHRPVRNAHYSQPATEERQLYGAIGHIKHWNPCLGVILGEIILSWYMHHVWYPNRPVRNTPLLPTGHRGMGKFDSTMGHVKHIKHWKPSPGA